MNKLLLTATLGVITVLSGLSTAEAQCFGLRIGRFYGTPGFSAYRNAARFEVQVVLKDGVYVCEVRQVAPSPETPVPVPSVAPSQPTPAPNNVAPSLPRFSPRVNPVPAPAPAPAPAPVAPSPSSITNRTLPGGNSTFVNESNPIRGGNSVFANTPNPASSGSNTLFLNSPAPDLK